MDADKSLFTSFRSTFYWSRPILAYFASPEGMNLQCDLGEAKHLCSLTVPLPRYAYTHIFTSPKGLNKILDIRNGMVFNPFGVDLCCVLQPRTPSVALHIQALLAYKIFVFKPLRFCVKRLAILGRLFLQNSTIILKLKYKPFFSSPYQAVRVERSGAKIQVNLTSFGGICREKASQIAGDWVPAGMDLVGTNLQAPLAIGNL